MKNNREVPFKVTRIQHASETAEDYTELISDLICNDGEARVGQIAKNLGITHVTASKTVRRLEKEGYVKATIHKPILLTPKGKRLAKKSKEKHLILLKLFDFIGIPKKISEIDVEGIEHHISNNTLKYIKMFLADKI